MRDKVFSLDPGAAMLLGLLIFTLQWKELLALLSAAAVHELGHLAALKSFRIPIYRFSLSAAGPVLRCGETDSRYKRAVSAISGPFAGLALWLMMKNVWPLCAELSLFLSLTNLLPILPLDGGRVLFAIVPNKKVLTVLGHFARFSVMLLGLAAVRSGYGLGLIAFGVWLVLLSCQGDENDIK